MSSGDRFLYKTSEITIPRQTLVDITAAWLYATRAIKDASNISNIQFSDLFGASDTEYVKLKIHTNGGSQKESGT